MEQHLWSLMEPKISFRGELYEHILHIDGAVAEEAEESGAHTSVGVVGCCLVEVDFADGNGGTIYFILTPTSSPAHIRFGR